MSLFSRVKDFFTGKEKRSMESVRGGGRYPWQGYVGKTGVAVTYDTTMTLSGFYRASWVLSSSMGSLPLNIYEKNGKVTKINESHPINILLNRKPHSLYNPFIFKQTIMMHLLLQGNCYVLKNKDVYNQIESLYIIPLGEVEVYFDKVLQLKQFKWESKNYTDDEIIHFIGLGFNGLVGKSPVTLARENYEGSLAAQQYGNTVFANGVFGSGALEHPGALSDKAYERIKESFAKSYAGLKNAGKPMILEEGGKFNPMKLNVEDAMFIEKGKMTVLDIARWVGVPPHILYELSKSSFNNIESLGIEFVTYTLRNWCEMWESTLNCDLLRTDDYPKRELRFNLDAMLRGDSKSRSDYYKNMFYSGAFSSNDILKFEGYNPVEGGDNRYVQSNMIPTDLVREFYLKEENNGTTTTTTKTNN